MSGFLLLQPGTGVGDLNIQLSSSLDNSLSIQSTDSMSYFSSMSSVVHQQYFQFLYIMNHELLEAIGVDMFSLQIRTETYFGHFGLASISSTESVINTSGSSPGSSQFVRIVIRLMSNEVVHSLLHNLLSLYRSHHFIQ